MLNLLNFKKNDPVLVLPIFLTSSLMFSQTRLYQLRFKKLRVQSSVLTHSVHVFICKGDIPSLEKVFALSAFFSVSHVYLTNETYALCLTSLTFKYNE